VTSGPISTTNVFETGTDAANFSGNYSPQTVGSQTINSLTFTGAVNSPVTLQSGTLTLDAATGFTDTNTSNSYAAGIGLVVESGAAANTISANVDLGASQTWEIDSANALTVSGTIADAVGTSLDALTKTGNGTLILSASNTYNGGTTVSAGTIQLSSGGSIGSAGALTVQGTGTFDLHGNNQSVTGLSDGGVSTGTITSSVGSATLTVNPNVTGTFSGTITDGGSGNSLSLTFAGPSTETLSGNNSYTGLTTVTGGTLIAASNSALGSSTSATGGLLLNPSSGTATVDFTSANPTIASLSSSGAGTSDVVLGSTSGAGTSTTLTITGAGTATSGSFGGVISDLTSTVATAIGNLNVSGGSLILGGANTFTGTTTISGGGTLTLANPLALQNSTLNYNSGGTLSFGTQTAVTLAGLSGSQNLALTNTTPAGVALTIGNLNVSSTYTGSLGGTGSVTKEGTGTVNFSNANYSGATTVVLGNLNISGGTFGSSTAAFNVDGNSGTAQTATATVSGGDLLAGTVSIGIGSNQYDAILTISGNASVTFSTGVVIGAAGDTGGGLDINSTGSTLSLGAVTVARDTGLAGTGLTVAGGAVTATSVDVQATGNSSVSNAQLNISGGSLTITAASGGLKIGDVAGTTVSGHTGTLTMTGGALTYLGSDGLLADATAPGSGVTTAGNVNITGGVATLSGITLNDADSTTAASELTVSGGATLYLGSVGLVENIPVGSTQAVTTTLGTATIGAIAPWSSSGAIALASGSTATFQAADSFNTANNIALSGTLSGGGGLAVSGAGSVTLSANDTYTGTTAVNAGGTLIVSGSLSGTTAASVASGGKLEVDGLLNSTISATVSGQLSGTGVIGGADVSGAGSTLAPGLTEADSSTAVGTLTAAGNVSLASSATLSIRLGLTTGEHSDPTTGLGGDVDQLFMNGGSFSLADSTTTLQILDTSAEYSAAIGSIYVIVNGSASAPTGTFGNALASGDDVIGSAGDTYEVFYDVNAANTGAGNDIDLELVAVPEPGTWASLIGGIGMLVVWQRSRRRRA
jgi:autotransporter-associated beta strand protein